MKPHKRLMAAMKAAKQMRGKILLKDWLAQQPKSTRKGVARGTKKAEPPPTRDVNRDSGTDSANGGWLRRLYGHNSTFSYGNKAIVKGVDCVAVREALAQLAAVRGGKGGAK